MGTDPAPMGAIEQHMVVSFLKTIRKQLGATVKTYKCLKLYPKLIEIELR